MFNAASVSSPDGGRTCFPDLKRKQAKEKRIAQQAIRFLIFGCCENLRDRRNVLRQHVFGEQPVPPARIILQLAGV